VSIVKLPVHDLAVLINKAKSEHLKASAAWNLGDRYGPEPHPATYLSMAVAKAYVMGYEQGVEDSIALAVDLDSIDFQQDQIADRLRELIKEGE
jgi:hypothetical protein